MGRNKNSIMENGPFGKRLARIRKDAGYSQRSFAEAAGISYRMVAYYESEGGNPPINVLSKLADTLDITTDELLGRKTSNNGSRTKFKNKRLLKKFLQLEELPPKERESVIRIIDGLIKKKHP